MKECPDRALSAAERMFSVLERCAASDRPLTLVDLVQRTGFPKSTLHRVCWELVGLGALESRDRGFAIGTKLFALGSMSPELRRLRAMSMPYMHKLVLESGWVCCLAVLLGQRALIAEEVYGATPPLPKMIGASLPLHASAVGKALLAAQPPERREELLRALVLRPATGNTIVRRERLRAHVLEITEDGIAFSRQEWRLGTSAVASPVLADGEPVAALGLLGPHHEPSLAPNGRLVRRGAAHLGRTLARSRELATA